MRPSGPRLVGCRAAHPRRTRLAQDRHRAAVGWGKAQGQKRGQLPRISQRSGHTGRDCTECRRWGYGGYEGVTFWGLGRDVKGGEEPRRIFLGFETHLRGRRWRLPRTTAWCCSTCLARTAMPARLRRGSALGPAQAARASSES